MRHFTRHDIEWSMYMRAYGNVVELMGRLYADDKKLPQNSIDHYREGVSRFMQAMISISKSNKYKGGNGMKHPFVVHRVIEV